MNTHTESYSKFKKKLLAGRPGFRAIYAASQPKFELVCKMIDARLAKNMTQGQLAKKLKTKQAVISRFESGQSNFSYDFLTKIANAVDKKIIFDLT